MVLLFQPYLWSNIFTGDIGSFSVWFAMKKGAELVKHITGNKDVYFHDILGCELLFYLQKESVFPVIYTCAVCSAAVNF